MKSQIHYSSFYLIVLSLCLTSCGQYADQSHLISKVLDGNSILLDDGVKINLIGVNHEVGIQSYLQQYYQNREVELEFDSESPVEDRIVRSQYAEVDAYVWYTDNANQKKLLNAELLNLPSTSSANLKNLNDYRDLLYPLLGPDRWSEEPNNCESCEQESLTGKQESNTDTTTDPKPMAGSTCGPGLSKKELAVCATEGAFMLHNTLNGRKVGLGSGFFINEDGIGLSNFHVVDDGNEWYVQMKNGTFYKVAEILLYHPQYDYVIFKADTEGKKVNYLKLSETPPAQGAEVMVVGNPQGNESVTTFGQVSSTKIARTSDAYRYKKAVLEENPDAFFMLDASISPGNSGGPVLEIATGQVLGISTFKNTRDCDQCNFALNTKIIQDFLNKLPN